MAGEAPSPVATSEVALHSHNFDKTQVGVDDVRQVELLKKVTTTRDEAGPRAAIELIVPERAVKLTPDEAARMAGEFGGGTNPPTPEGQRIQDEAMETMKSLSEWQQFSNLLDKAAREGKDPKTDPELKTQYDALRKSGLEALLKGSNIMSLGPELSKFIVNGDNAKLLEVIEVRLANDPKIRALVTEKLIAAKGKINFSEITDDPEIRAAEAKLGPAETEGTLDNQQNRIVNEIKTVIGDSVEDADIALINTLVKDGQSVAVILNRLELQMLHDNNKFDQVDIYNQIASTEKEAARIDAAIKAAKPGQNIETELSQAEYFKNNLNELLGKVTDSQKHELFKKLQKAMSAQKTSNGPDGIYQSPLAQRVDDLRKIDIQRKKAEDVLFTKQQTLEASRAKDIKVRLGEEEAALAELQKVLPSAVSEVLTERLLKIQEVEAANRKIEGDEKIQKGVADLRAAERENWMGAKDGKYIMDKVRAGKILESVKKVSDKIMDDEDPEEAFKQIAFDMLKDRWKRPLTTIKGGARTTKLIAPENYNQLTPDQKKEFDEIYRQEGPAMQAKLMGDFYAQRELQRWDQKKITGLKEALPNWMGGSDRMGLTDQQFAALNSKMKDLLVSGVQSTKEKNPAKIIREMQRDGLIPADADKKKLIPWIFGILGASIAIGATGGLAAAVPAGLGIAESGIARAVVGGAVGTVAGRAVTRH